MGTDHNDYAIRFTVTGLKPGVTYTLYRGEYTPVLKDDEGKWQAPGAYVFAGYDTTPITTWTGQPVLGDTTAAIYDNAPAPRKSYLYKLVSSIGDTLLGDGSVVTRAPSATSDLASVYSSLSLALDNSPAFTSAGDDDDKRGYIHASVTNSGYTPGVEVKLYYRRQEIPPLGVGAEVTEWTALPNGTFAKKTQTGGATTQITDEDGEFVPLKIQIPSAVFGEIYQFKAIAFLDGKEMPNLTIAAYSPPSLDTGIPGSGSTATETRALTTPVISLWGAPALNLATGAQTISGITGSFLNGAQINVRIARTSAPPISGKQTYWEQPGSFTLSRTTATAGGNYSVDIDLSALPPANDGGPVGTTPPIQENYTIQYKWPWEKWEDIGISNTIQTGISY
jgi:hypothetical protein